MSKTLESLHSRFRERREQVWLAKYREQFGGEE